MTSKFYKAEIDENGLVTLSPPAGEGGGIRTGRLGDPPFWLVVWERDKYDSKRDRLEIGKLKTRNNPDNPGEYKMHVEHKYEWYSRIPQGIDGGKLIFSDEDTGEKWRKLLKAVSRKQRWTDEWHWTAPNFEAAISEAMEDIGFADLLKEWDELGKGEKLRTHGWKPVGWSGDYPKTDRPHLCSVDSSNRCILYTRDSFVNYLQFTKFIEGSSEQGVVENPLAQAQPEPMVAESGIALDVPTERERDWKSSLFGSADSGRYHKIDGKGGGKTTKKRKRKTKKRKRKTKKLKSKRLKKTKRKKRKYTKRRR